jgi:hypothetical protein
MLGEDNMIVYNMDELDLKLFAFIFLFFAFILILCIKRR